MEAAPFSRYEGLLADFATFVRESGFEASSQELLLDGAAFAARGHAGVEQLEAYTGLPYIAHPIAVATVLIDHGRPPEEALGGLLHDLLEDTRVRAEEIAQRYGERAAAWTRQVSKVSVRSDGSRRARAEKDRVHYGSAEPGAQNVKLADVIVVARTISKRDPAFARVYLPEKKALVDVLVQGDTALRSAAEQLVNTELAALGLA